MVPAGGEPIKRRKWHAATSRQAEDADLTRREAILANLLVAGMFVAAVVPGILVTRSLEWPYDLDHFRDIASASTMIDGGGLEDPLYAGERAWYNPLIPALVAMTAGLLHAPVPETLARMGAWINILPPLAFLFCARRLIGPLAALPALCAFLFLPHNIPPWAAASYTPWLFPAVTAHALFYSGVLLWLRALQPADARSRHLSIPRLAIAGVVVGLTMLAHTGSALVLAGMIVVTAALTPAHLSPVGAHGLRGRLIAILLPGSIAAIVAAPFLLPLVTQYGLHVVNRAPGTWIEERLLFGNLIGLLRPKALPTIAIVSIGAIRLARQGLTLVGVLLLAWAGVATAGFIYSTLSQSSQTLPTIVSSYHFYFLLRALSCLAFGAGFVRIARALAAWWSRRQDTRATHATHDDALPGGASTIAPRGVSSVSSVSSASSVSNVSSVSRVSRVGAVSLTLVIALLLAASLYRGYLERPALTIAPYAARHVGEQVDDREASRWIRAHTARDAVFLAYDDDAMRIVGAAGRKALCVDPFFSNPYVDRQPRHEARDRLFAALVTSDRETFRAIAAPWGVTHVLFRPSGFRTLSLERLPWVQPGYQRADIVVARVTP